MKKNVILTCVLLLSSAQSFSSDAAKARRAHKCCGLYTAVSKMQSCFGTLGYRAACTVLNNDYLHLAHSNNVWFLRKKLALKEDMQHVDTHAVCYGIGGRGMMMWIKRTPLQEAVIRGHLDSVQILLAAGADKNKRTESREYEYDAEDFLGKHSKPFVIDSQEKAQAVEQMRKKSDIGLSSVDLACKCIEKSTEYDSVSIEQRKAILALLQKNN